MASTYSDRLKLELMETGANANTWGNNTNTNLETLDAFTAGYLSKSVAGSANVTLTTANADPTAESSNKVIEFTGTLTGDITVFVPAVENNYIFFNNTSGAFTLTVAPTGHGSNGSAIVQGAHTVQYCTGDTMVDLFANSLGNLSVKNNVNVVGTVNATSYVGNGAGLSGVDPFPSGTKQVFYQASAPTGWTQDTTAALGNAAFRIVTGTGGGTGGTDEFGTTFGSSRSTATGSLPISSLPVSGSVSGSVGNTTLSTPQLGSHNHQPGQDVFAPDDNNANQANTVAWSGRAFSSKNPQTNEGPFGANPVNAYNNNTFSNAGGGGNHSHPFSGNLSGANTGSGNTGNGSFSIPGMNLKFANVIIAAKD